MEKRLVLQHWSGTPGWLEGESFRNIERYAAMVGTEYRLLRGDVYDARLTSPCQKLAMLNEEFDAYDTVVMLDPDMFMRRGLTESIFDVPGIGLSTEDQRRLKWAHFRKRPWTINPFATYWSGAVWKTTRAQRQAIRARITERDRMRYTGGLEDEGIMHRACGRAGLRAVLPGGDRWCHVSYLPGVETAALIHIRPKRARKGPKVPKAQILTELRDRGIID